MSKPARHVFVVDDEALITESLALILSREGFIVSSFTNPLEALEHMKTTPPGLLISDVMMPQLSGIDLAIQVRDTYPECRILLFSGHALTTGLMQEARMQGLDFLLLQKPVHPKELLLEISRLQASPASLRG